MKIAHLCLSCFYIDKGRYQENLLVQAHVAQGHDVRVIASTENYDRTGKLTYSPAERYTGSDGALVIRLPYVSWLPAKLARKLRVHPGVMRELRNFDPDVIMFHGLAGWELRTAARYVRENPMVLFYADSHEDHHNSAKSFLSRELLHKRFYGPVLRGAQEAAETLLCISLETIDFVHEVYRIPKDRLTFYPLGGNIMPPDTHAALRQDFRSRLGLKDGEIMLLQTGKFGPLKKLPDSLHALAALPNAPFRFFIAGYIDPDMEMELAPLIAADSGRVRFLGWQGSKDMAGLLAAADVYLQPGSQSVTLQASLCSGCAVIVDDAKSHSPFLDGTGWQITSDLTLREILSAIADDPSEITRCQTAAMALARNMLDYNVLSQQVLQPKGGMS